MLLPLLIAFGHNELADPPSGVYLEARTAAVFAGACHIGAQRTTQGREAVLGWHIEGGSDSGVVLEGVDIVVALAGDKNLAEKDVVKSSVVILDADATVDQRAAALAWLVREHGALLGNVVEVRTAAVEVALVPAAERAVGRELQEPADGLEHFRLTVGKEIELGGTSLPERACCKMPYMVGYEPLVPTKGRRVGYAELFRFSEAKLSRTFERREENSAFFGRFGGA